MYRGREKGSINNIPIATFQLALSWKLPIIKLTVNTKICIGKTSSLLSNAIYKMVAIRIVHVTKTAHFVKDLI